MKWSRRYILSEIIRTGYALRSFLPVLYFAACYTGLTLLSGVAHLVVSSVAIIIGIALVEMYILRSRSNVVTNTSRYTRIGIILTVLTLSPLVTLYMAGDTFLPLGAALISSLGLVASGEHTTPLKKLLVKLYPKGVTVYEARYPFYLHFFYALTHKRRDYGDFEADQTMSEILLTISTEHEIGFISFNSESDYLEWLNNSHTVMACEMCYKNKECKGADADVKGIYASDFDPTRMSICGECQDSITKKLINKEGLEAGEVTASRI